VKTIGLRGTAGLDGVSRDVSVIERQKSVKRLRNGKGPGADEAYEKMIKYGGRNLLKCL